jgi:hypothetical protein
VEEGQAGEEWGVVEYQKKKKYTSHLNQNGGRGKW